MSDDNVVVDVNTVDEQLPPKRVKKLWRRLLKSILRVGVAAYLGLALILTSCQSKLVYYPSDEIITTQLPHAVNGLKVKIRNATIADTRLSQQADHSL